MSQIIQHETLFLCIGLIMMCTIIAILLVDIYPIIKFETMKADITAQVDKAKCDEAKKVFGDNQYSLEPYC